MKPFVFFLFGLFLIRSEAAETAAPKTTAGFVLKSSVVPEGAAIPVEFTGDGAGISPPIEWKGAPAKTKSYVVIMHHFPHEGDAARWYWTLYNIPANVTSLPKGVKGVGVNGTNCVSSDLAYAPPHSKGPGMKKYTITVYALSEAPKISVPAKQVNRDALLAAIKGITLAQAELNFTYDRTGVLGADSSGDARSAKPKREAAKPDSPAGQ